jgi:hypothetical protein
MSAPQIGANLVNLPVDRGRAREGLKKPFGLQPLSWYLLFPR